MHFPKGVSLKLPVTQPLWGVAIKQQLSRILLFGIEEVSQASALSNSRSWVNKTGFPDR